jgi:hypothetical protein
MEDKCADNTLVGVVTGVVDNNEKTSPAIKMCDAWGEMVRQSNLLFYYLKVNISTYPEFVPSRQSRAEVFHPINDFGI